MEFEEKVGLVLVLVGVVGASINREGIMFWLTLIVFTIGYFMFIGNDLKPTKKPQKE